MEGSEMQYRMAERVAAGYQEDGQLPRVRKVRKLFSQLPEGGKVLDVGCADGGILAPFAGRMEIHGVDISPGLIEKALKNGLKARVHDAVKPLPFPDKTFDVVFSGETIEHQIDTDWFLSEINRVLKPGGQFVLTFPNIRTLASFALLLLDLPPMFGARYRSGHFRDFTVRTMKIALANNGFKPARFIGADMYLPGFGQTASALCTHLPSWSLTVVVQSAKIRDVVYSPEEASDTVMAR
jgi:SAM-dependent methyltransferase